MKTDRIALTIGGLALAVVAHSQEGPIPRGIPRLDHVFVVMMENHGYSQMLGNPNAPFINGYMKAANLATNYFAVAHPSLTNHLEIVGGSNFGVLSDNDPDWHSATCQPNLSTGHAATDHPPSPPICPIAGVGTEAPMPAIDFTNQNFGPRGTVNLESSPVWRKGKTAIVVVWDENDYSDVPYNNQVVLTVDTNYGPRGVRSGMRYTHFSLLRSLESGFQLPCLNHACDQEARTMSDLFGGTRSRIRAVN